jgi:hypothetical protein
MVTDSNKPENSFNLSDLSQKDRIQILLNEYNTLRSEIMARTGYGFQLLPLGGAVITWLIQTLLTIKATLSIFSVWFLGIAIFIISVVYIMANCVNARDLKAAARRVKELEHEINSRAGEHLLIWETLSGLLNKMGLWKSFFSKARPLPRTELPPLDPSYLKRETAKK